MTYNQWTFVSCSSGDMKSKIRCLHSQALVKDLFQAVDCQLHPASWTCGRARECCHTSFIQALISFLRVLPQDLISSQRSHFPVLSPWGSAYESEADTDAHIQVALVIKNLSANEGDIKDAGLIPGLGRSPGGGYSNPLQISCLENPMDRGAWQHTVHGVSKCWTWLKQLSMHAHRFSEHSTQSNPKKNIRGMSIEGHFTRNLTNICQNLSTWLRTKTEKLS